MTTVTGLTAVETTQAPAGGIGHVRPGTTAAETVTADAGNLAIVGATAVCTEQALVGGLALGGLTAVETITVAEGNPVYSGTTGRTAVETIAITAGAADVRPIVQIRQVQTRLRRTPLGVRRRVARPVGLTRRQDVAGDLSSVEAS